MCFTDVVTIVLAGYFLLFLTLGPASHAHDNQVVRIGLIRQSGHSHDLDTAIHKLREICPSESKQESICGSLQGGEEIEITGQDEWQYS